MRVCPGCRKTYPAEKTTCDQDGLPLLDVSCTFADVGPDADPPPTTDGLDRLLTPGMMVGEYMVERMLAEGGMGNIYAGIHPLISKRVAIKVLSSRYAGSDRAVARFVLEARSVNQIGHHNIVDIFSIGELDDGRNYMVMELLDGLPMHEVLQRVGRLKPGEVIPLYEQLCDALEATHQKGFVHRDLKPDNVIVLRRPPFPFLKILDFGITKLRSHKLKEQTEIGTVLGTPEYMAPEQCRGDEIDVRADIYALGVMLYELLTGKKPFTDPNPLRILTLQMRKPPKPPSSLAPISKELERVVLKAMAKDRSKRFTSAKDLFDALDEVVDRRLTWRFDLGAEPRGRALAEQVRTLPPKERPAPSSPDGTPTPPPSAVPIAPPIARAALATTAAGEMDSFSETELQPHAARGRPIADDFAMGLTAAPPSNGSHPGPRARPPSAQPAREKGMMVPQQTTLGIAPSRTLPMPFGQALSPEKALSTPHAHELECAAPTEVDFQHADTVIDTDAEEAKATIEAPVLAHDTDKTTLPLETPPAAAAQAPPAVHFEVALPPASGEIGAETDDDGFSDAPTNLTQSSVADVASEEVEIGATAPLVRIETDMQISDDEHTELVPAVSSPIDPRFLEAQRVHQRMLMITAGALMMVVAVLSLVVIAS